MNARLPLTLAAVAVSIAGAAAQLVSEPSEAQLVSMVQGSVSTTAVDALRAVRVVSKE